MALLLFKWITLCHKNHMSKLVITFWHKHVTSLTATMSAMPCLSEIMYILKAI